MLDLRPPPQHASGCALRWGAQTWTHEALHEAATRASQPMRAGHKELVFLYARNHPDTVIGLLAAWACDHAVVLLDAGLAPPQRQQLLFRYQPEWEIEDGVPRRRPGPPGPPLHRDLALLLSTSGSSGGPRMVRLSAQAVEGNARAIAQALRLQAGDRQISSLPLSYAYGLSLLTSHLVAGATLALTDESPVQRPFWRYFEEAGCTSFAGVPTSYQVLHRLGIEKLAPASLRVMTQAGGRLSPALALHFHDWLQARGGQLWLMYGQTEATARITALPPERLAQKPDSVGPALPGGQLWIDAGQGPTRAPGLLGEVLYQGPGLMMGYAQDRADLAQGDTLQGPLRTGDLGRLDEEGFLYLTGRSRRIAKVYGLRIDLDLVEGMLQEHGPTAVIGAEDELLIHCAWGDAAAQAQAGRELAARLRVHRSALRFFTHTDLPLTARGKIDYAALEGEAGSEGPDGPAAGPEEPR